MKVESKITVSQAIEEGYTHYIASNGDRFQRARELSELGDDFSYINNVPMILVEKEPYYYSFEGNELSEVIAEHIYNTVGDDSGDDDLDDVYEGVKKIDFSLIADQVNAIMSTRPYYRATTIQVVTDKTSL